jgi:hypothetical protein
MAAKDYTFGAGWRDIYLTKKTKPRKDGLHIMSTDRRPLEECEILYIFEHYLRKWCENHEGEDTIFIKGNDGKLIFKATLLDKEDDV